MVLAAVLAAVVHGVGVLKKEGERDGRQPGDIVFAHGAAR